MVFSGQMAYNQMAFHSLKTFSVACCKKTTSRARVPCLVSVLCKIIVYIFIYLYIYTTPTKMGIPDRSPTTVEVPASKWSLQKSEPRSPLLFGAPKKRS